MMLARIISLFCCLFLAIYSPQALTAPQQTKRAFELNPVADVKLQNELQRSSAMADKVLPGLHVVKMNSTIAGLGVGATIDFPLPGFAQAARGTINSTRALKGGDLEIRGSFAGGGFFQMVMNKAEAYGAIFSDELRFTLTTSPEEGSYIIDHRFAPYKRDTAQPDFLVPPQKLQIPNQDHGDVKGANQRNDGIVSAMSNSGPSTTIDIMVVYSDAFASGFVNPLTRINQMISFANDAYERSEILINLNLVHAQQLAFSDATSPGTLLNAVTDSLTPFEGIPALRDQYGADLVAVLPYVGGNGISGIAWIGGDPSDQSHAFSVAQFASWGSDAVFTHELGHNLGSGHERQSANPAQSSPCNAFAFRSYACGHGDAASATEWGTIMSYLQDAVVGYKFSNPEIDCGGVACGVLIGAADEADNRTAFNLSRFNVAAFRTASQPDLQVESAAVTNTTPEVGESFNFSATVRNYGSANAASTTLRYYRSLDATITSGDVAQGTDAVGSLASNANSPQSISLSAPLTIGTYWYGACVDSVSGESDTNNNCSPAVQVTVNPASTPDLIADSASVSSSSLMPGQLISLAARVRNQGTAAASTTTLNYYLSNDASITTADSPVGSDAIVALAANASSSETIDINAPGTVGTYWLGACVAVVSGESDVNNNCTSGVQISVSLTAAPDLVVQSPIVSTTTLNPGDLFSFTAVVRNQGNANSAASTLRYYQSDNELISNADTELANEAIASIAIGAGSAINQNFTAAATAGNYWIGACVDSVATEVITANNCSTGVPITVTNAALDDDFLLMLIPSIIANRKRRK